MLTIQSGVLKLPRKMFYAYTNSLVSLSLMTLIKKVVLFLLH